MREHHREVAISREMDGKRGWIGYMMGGYDSCHRQKFKDPHRPLAGSEVLQGW